MSNDVIMQQSIFKDHGFSRTKDWKLRTTIVMSLWGFLCLMPMLTCCSWFCFFNHLISCSLLCWFSFILCLRFGHLQVFKSAKPLVPNLFLYVFASWSFASFSRVSNLQCSFSFFLCLLFGLFCRSLKHVKVSLLTPSFSLWSFN
jgi:hypothetical protein